MPGILWRILFAVIAVVLIYALIPPFLRIVGFEANADLMLIVRVCIAGIAIFYVLRGPNWPVPPA